MTEKLVVGPNLTATEIRAGRKEFDARWARISVKFLHPLVESVYRKVSYLAGVRPSFAPVYDTDPHPLIVTLQHDGPKEFIGLEIRAKPVPRRDYQMLRNLDTGELMIYKPDATWGDCQHVVVRCAPGRGQRPT